MFIAAVVYLEYFILIPKLWMKHQKKCFFVISLLVLTVSAIAEVLLVRSDIRTILSGFSSMEFEGIIRDAAFNIFLRNICFYMFFFIIKLNKLIEIKILKAKQVDTKASELITINLPDGNTNELRVKEIGYINISKYCVILHQNDGEEIMLSISFSNFEKRIPEHLFLRINRNIAVSYDNIVSYNNDGVSITFREQLLSFNYYATKQEQLVQSLQNWNRKLYYENDSAEVGTNLTLL
ncbi:MAG: LytTR family transcriptional regulator DNA-binding domain-containing protein [Bacteroidales bacterium]|nr:LytTR family transcriptional regulator DNA-binding domain-containing protein [Bacteroidales bacterium]